MEDKKVVYRAEFNKENRIVIAAARVEKIDEAGFYHVSFDVPDCEPVFLYSSRFAPDFAHESVPLALCALASRCQSHAESLEIQAKGLRSKEMAALLHLQFAVQGSASGMDSPSK